MTEVSAANGIREVLSGMQASSTNFLFSSAEKGSDYSASDFGQDFAKEAGWLALGLLAGAYMPKFVSSLGGGRMWSRAKLTQRWGNPTSDALRKSMVQAQVIQRNASGHAHHIVPGTHNLGDAIEVRSHLAASGVQANDYQNGVLLTTAEHKGLHTKDYYAKVLARLKPIHGKSALHMELELIGQEIKAGNFP